MQWLKIDSLLADNPKWLRIDDMQTEYLLFHVWLIANRNETDGRLDGPLLKRAGYNAHVTQPAKLQKLLAALVANDNLHDADGFARCEACLAEYAGDPPADGSVVIHGYNDCNLVRADKTDESKQFKKLRHNALKKLKSLKAEIRARDRDYCRYCGIRINMNDHVSTEGGQHDHVDPDGKNTLANVVRSCRGCNIYRKGERTPAEAGMEMLPPPKRGVAPPIPAWRLTDDPFGVESNKPMYPLKDEPEWWNQPATDPVPDPVPDPGSTQGGPGVGPPENPGSDPGPASRSARVGPEPGRNRVEPGVGNRVGPDRFGTARVGPALLGTGLLGCGREPDPTPDREQPAPIPSTSPTTDASPTTATERGAPTA